MWTLYTFLVSKHEEHIKKRASAKITRSNLKCYSRMHLSTWKTVFKLVSQTSNIHHLVKWCRKIGCILSADRAPSIAHSSCLMRRIVAPLILSEMLTIAARSRCFNILATLWPRWREKIAANYAGSNFFLLSFRGCFALRARVCVSN